MGYKEKFMEAVSGINGSQVYKAILGLLVGYLTIGTFTGSPEEYENTYVCDATETYGVFYGGISGTAYTAYPSAEDRKGYKRCISGDGIKGDWVLLIDYCEANGFDPEEYLLGAEPITDPEPEPTPTPNNGVVIFQDGKQREAYDSGTGDWVKVADAPE